MVEATQERPRPLRAEDFEPFVGHEARFGDTGVALMLDAVQRLSGAPPPGFREPFSLIFSEPKGVTHLAEGIYVCCFEDGATFVIHVAPIHTPSRDRQNYQSVFN